MKTDIEETRVVFRRWRDTGDIIALFPDIEEGGGRISSYMRVGQHGPAARGIVTRTCPVDLQDADVQSLLRELRSVGYNPRVVRRLTRGKVTS